MNVFAGFDENPSKTLQDIKEKKHYGLADGWTERCMDGKMDGQLKNSIPAHKHSFVVTVEVVIGVDWQVAHESINYE